MSEIQENKNGGSRRGAGRPKGSRNKQRSMVQTLQDLKISSIEDLANHYHDLQRLVKNSNKRDDPRDSAHTKNLVIQRGQTLRGLLPYSYHKQAQIVEVETVSTRPVPMSIKLTRPKPKMLPPPSKDEIDAKE